MKNIYFFFASLCIASFIACGPSQKEEEKQKKMDDSLMESERDAAIDKANELLMDTLIPAKDSTVKKESKPKK